MKVIAINGSPKKNGNTVILIKKVFTELEKEGIETKLIQLGGQPVRGCMACMKCFQEKNRCCAITTDPVNDIIGEMLTADGIILASPTYFANVSSELKALIDRAGLVAIANDAMLKRKVGAAVVAVRRAGALPVFDAINHFFTINQMIIPGSCYWNLGIGRMPGEVENDPEGLNTMRILGENMGWLLKKLNS